MSDYAISKPPWTLCPESEQMSLVWAQVDSFTGLAVRIFKTHMAAVSSGASIKSMDRGLAVSQIRRQVFTRQDGLCLKCGAIITRMTMHMDEILARGEFDENGKSGEISLENCQGLCSPCHIGPRGEHGNRRPQFSNRTDWEP